MNSKKFFKHRILPGLFVTLVSCPGVIQAEMYHRLIGPQEEQAWIIIKGDGVTGVGPAVRVSAIPGSINSNFVVKVNLQTRGHCEDGGAYIEYGWVYDLNGNSNKAEPYYGKQTEELSFPLVGVTTTEELRRLCGDGNKTISRSFTLRAGIKCSDPVAVEDLFDGYNGGFHREDIEIPLRITCENVLDPEKIAARVTPGEIKMKCPQLTPYQPQSGAYFDNYRIVVSGMRHGHVLVDASADNRPRPCVRLKESNADVHYDLVEVVQGTQ